jgi:putative two-component system hydrogenase maturation factor HypX/HoxX
MRILLISSAFSGLTQRFYAELEDAGFLVSVELHLGDIAQLIDGVSLFKPDLILCPFLTRRLPKEIYQNIKSCASPSEHNFFTYLIPACTRQCSRT